MYMFAGATRSWERRLEDKMIKKDQVVTLKSVKPPEPRQPVTGVNNVCVMSSLFFGGFNDIEIFGS